MQDKTWGTMHSSDISGGKSIIEEVVMLAFENVEIGQSRYGFSKEKFKGFLRFKPAEQISAEFGLSKDLQ